MKIIPEVLAWVWFIYFLFPCFDLSLFSSFQILFLGGCGGVGIPVYPMQKSQVGITLQPESALVTAPTPKAVHADWLHFTLVLRQEEILLLIISNSEQIIHNALLIWLISLPPPCLWVIYDSHKYTCWIIPINNSDLHLISEHFTTTLQCMTFELYYLVQSKDFWSTIPSDDRIPGIHFS